MYSTLATLIDRLDSTAVAKSNVIGWGSPVPAFGDPSMSRVATLGLNPSNREFVDELGKELDGPSRRFHTLASLGLASWSQVESRHLRQILDSCRWYFLRNPYDRWFKRLDQVIAGSGASYYVSNGACHLDLIPYATACKWTELSPQQRSSLIKVSGDTLGMLLRNSPVRLLVLNGRSVVELFEEVSRARLQRVIRREWNLPRKSGTPVIGMAYMGSVEAISDIDLGYRLCVIGYNHNIQSSYGVTAEAIAAIRDWIAEGSREAM